MLKIGDFSNITRVLDVLLRHRDQIDQFKQGHLKASDGTVTEFVGRRAEALRR